MMQFFKDGQNDWSMMRLLCFLWSTVTVGVWCYLSLKGGAMQDIPNGLGLILAGLFGSKAAQSFAEGKNVK